VRPGALGFHVWLTHSAVVTKEASAQDATLPGPALMRQGPGAASGFAVRWVFPADDGPATVLRPGTTTLGRDSECGGYLPSASVSRRHAEIRWQPGGAPMLRDVESRNGVFLNGRTITQAPLRPGDVLRLGDWIGIVAAATPEGFPAWTFQQFSQGYWGGPLMSARLAPARLVAGSDLSVIIQGATGTGKEGAARAIHEWSARSGPFVAVNCAAIPENLAEAELFGYRKGAFTGAERASAGLLRAAHAGTLFLDEVSDLPLATQPKLLRALERREVVPIGESTAVPIDIRLVTATQEPLRKAVHEKRFRSDLLARLEGLTVMLPSLRDRAEDIPFLLTKLLEQHGRTPSPRLDPLLVERLCLYDWPFNVRELSQFVRRVVALHPGADLLEHTLLADAAEANIFAGSKPGPPEADETPTPAQGEAAAAVPPAPEFTPAELDERKRITLTLAEAMGSQTAAAKKLGVSRSTLIERMKRFRIPRPRSRI
jgi:DNA-binding NtrC family response regulator